MSNASHAPQIMSCNVNYTCTYSYTLIQYTPMIKIKSKTHDELNSNHKHQNNIKHENIILLLARLSLRVHCMYNLGKNESADLTQILSLPCNIIDKSQIISRSWRQLYNEAVKFNQLPLQLQGSNLHCSSLELCSYTLKNVRMAVYKTCRLPLSPHSS